MPVHLVVVRLATSLKRITYVIDVPARTHTLLF